MNSPSTAVKVITVSVFTVLIVCFISYRVGAFDDPSSEMSVYNSAPTALYTGVDTPVVPQDSVVIELKNIEMMTSSKSMVMPRTYKQDTLKKIPADTPKKKPLKPRNTMSSSKSGIIYEPEPDTAKPKK